jgi:O-methyltransferase involved in polyketide biosynthesis
MPDKQVAGPENTAVRVALWRALHLEVDDPPYVLEDDVGLELVAPDEGWRSRPDMSPFTRPFRASILARARFIEDLVAEQASRGVGQYVILGAGLDTFAQRRPELASRLLVFEIDQPGPQAWKRQRLVDLGLGIGIERAAAGAKANGTPFISFFKPTEMLALAREAGFGRVEHVSAAGLAQRYFADRTDGLRPPNNSEELLVATTEGTTR